MSTIAEIFETLEYGPAPESAARAEAWLEGHGREFGLYINGAWVGGSDGDRFETVNPATGDAIAHITQAGAADVDRAVRAAAGAQRHWWELGGHGRARHLYAVSRHLQKHSRLFSVLESIDNGKPIRESRDIDIPLVARHFYHHAGWAQLMASELRGYAPVGVVGQIVPWNFPLLMLAWKVAPALAMGNTVVLKPAEFTSLTALLFAELCEEVGLPPGVVNVVTGDGRTGAAIVAHSDVDKIAFTGSTEVGRIIRRETAGSGKRLSLELGGKSPFVVYEDADLDGVVEGVVDVIWFNQGQVCCAGSRILVQEGVAETLETKLKARMETLRMGDPLDKAVDMGAIIAPVQLEKIQSLVEQGREEGARIWQPSWSTPAEGYFYPPTLCTDVAPAATIAQVEIFGPVVVMMSFRTPAESVELANNTRYGLAASVWTENINLALDVAPKLKAGTVWINCTNVFDAASGFGGYRESGFGREGGLEGLWEYVRPEWRLERSPKGASESDVSTPGIPQTAGSFESPFTGPVVDGADVGIDRTAKLYVAGKQVRPDGGYSVWVRNAAGEVVGEAGRGNRKDIRNAVEAAHAAAAWSFRTAHNRAQILYYIAENLSTRAQETASRIQTVTGCSGEGATEEVDVSIQRLFGYAARADKWDGRVHHTPYRNVTLAMPESLGVVGIVCPDEDPLLAFVSLVAPAIAMGNTTVVVPSERWPLLATDFYQVLDASDLPDGIVNIVTGTREELAPVLAAHDDVDAIWYFGRDAGGGDVEGLSTGNMKRTWTDAGAGREWRSPDQGEGDEFLREATQIKNIWIPYGE